LKPFWALGKGGYIMGIPIIGIMGCPSVPVGGIMPGMPIGGIIGKPPIGWFI